MRVYYDNDADLARLLDKKIAVVGYGSQGHAHALNLRDSGVKSVAVALRPGSASARKAQAEGLPVKSVAEAAAWADALMVLAPDELQRGIWETDIAPNIRDGAALLFAHGLNIHFKLIEPRASIDVLMVAPKGPGHTVRSEYLRGGGVPCSDRGGPGRHRRAGDRSRPRLYASAIGGDARASSRRRSGKSARPTCSASRRFSCGGLVELIRAVASRTLVDAGYALEMAYFECLQRGEADRRPDLRGRHRQHELFDLQHGRICGEYVSGPRAVSRRDQGRGDEADPGGHPVEAAFVRDFMLENQAEASPASRPPAAAPKQHQIEEVGARLRAMMPWIAKNKTGRHRKKLAVPNGPP